MTWPTAPASRCSSSPVLRGGCAQQRLPAALLPTLPKVASTLWAPLDGTMLEPRRLYHVPRAAGLHHAVAVGLPLGIMMRRSRGRLLPPARGRADADPVARLGAGMAWQHRVILIVF
jgi:hypothetical protein